MSNVITNLCEFYYKANIHDERAVKKKMDNAQFWFNVGHHYHQEHAIDQADRFYLMLGLFRNKTATTKDAGKAQLIQVMKKNKFGEPGQIMSNTCGLASYFYATSMVDADPTKVEAAQKYFEEGSDMHRACPPWYEAFESFYNPRFELD